MGHAANRVWAIAAFGLVLLGLATAQADGFPGGFKEAWGPFYEELPPLQQPQAPASPQLPKAINQAATSGALGGRKTPTMDLLRHWNRVAIDASGLDHTPVAPGENRIFGEQFGPCRAARAMAIVHIAMFEAVNAIGQNYQSYTGLQPASGIEMSAMDAAIAQSAHDTLVTMFPSQTASLDQQLTADLNSMPNKNAKAAGIELGKRAAASILTLRANDGSQHAEPRVGIEFITSTEPGKWRQDPISQIPIALGAYWGGVRPFVMTSSAQFRLPPAPALDTPDFLTALAEVKQLGGDGVITPTQRTADQTFTGIYWAYDGTPSLCAPPRLYNQITVQIAEQMKTDVTQTARLLALVNVALADAAIASWETKFFYQYGRPITIIREANPATYGETNWTPLGAPASNLAGPDFTPPFPSYPSGHATLGGALFETLRMFFGTDNIAFTFISDELNGVTRDNAGNVRPLVPRSFSSLSQAEEENGQSRIYLGIHWAFDKNGGIAQGRLVARQVYQNAFLPLR